MRDGVVRPETERFEFGGEARFVLGAGVVAGFLEPEGMEGQHRSIVRHVPGPQRQGARRAVANPGEAAEEAVEEGGALMRQEVEGVTHQMAVQHGDGGGALAQDDVGQGGQVGLLPLVQRERPDGFEQRGGLRDEGRIVGEGEYPGLAEMGHGKLRRGLAGGIELADGVAVHEDEGSDRFVAGADGLGGRAR